MASVAGSEPGNGGDGTIIWYNLSNGTYQTTYGFAGPTSDGQDGLDNDFIWNGTIYGMTKYGGDIPTATSRNGQPTYDAGVIFSIPLPGTSA
jgi:hypothetical protein